MSISPYFLKSEIDPEGGINYSVTSVQQLLSVPYALYAQSAGNIPAFAVTPTDTGYVLVLTMPNGTVQSYVLRNGHDGADGAPGADGADGAPGATGATGQSAYEIWQTAGNTGTVADFLASLVGPTGAAGAPGQSAYDLWLAAGHTGTVADFLASLVGADGADGTPGTPGANGNGIDTITGPTTVGLNDTYTIHYTNGTTSTFVVKNGATGATGQSAFETWQASGHPNTTITDFLASLVGATGATGNGIANITGPSTVGLNDTYTIHYTNGTTSTFVVKNGAAGANGTDGQSAYDIWKSAGHTGTVTDFLNSLVGATGAAGNGIANITGPVSSGLNDTYTINFTNGNTYNFVVKNGTAGADGTNGTNGQSAYEIWRAAGNTGTEADFLASLVGTPGAAGANGQSAYDLWIAAGNTGTVADFLASLVGTPGAAGANGQSAYDLWIAAGNTGTVADFLASLVGDPGATGATGATGNGIATITGPVTAGLEDTYTIHFTNDSIYTFVVKNGAAGANGTNGENGQSAYDIWKAAGNTGTEADFLASLVGANGTNGQSAYEIWQAAGNTGTVTEFLTSLVGATGATGKGIDTITGPVTDELTDTYTINYTDGTTSTFMVKNGAKGDPGVAGNGITSITGPVSSGSVDTYTITFTDGSTFPFTVTNGAKGDPGVGVPQTLSIDSNVLSISDGNSVTLPIAGGLSAYQIWKNAGNTGTEADFLASLIGKTGNGISGITGPATTGNVDTYTINFTDGTSTTFDVTNGVNGADGNGITAITGPTTIGLEDTYTIKYTNGDSTQFVVTNGKAGKDGESAYQLWLDAGNTGTMADFFASLKGATGETGNGIASITPTSTVGLVNTYTVTYTDGTTSTFTVNNGADGANGNDGRGIDTIISTSVGLVDTYVISYTDGTSYEFTVNNGTPGAPGAPGKGITNIAKTGSVGNVDTYTINYTDLSTSTFEVTNGTNGANGFSPTISVTPVSGGINVTITDADGPHTTTIPTTSGETTQLPADWEVTDPTSPQFILHKPTINNAILTIKQGSTVLGTFTANSGDNTTISIPEVPAQVNADWDATSGVSQILNKPALATVATSGNYNDLSNKPTIPTVGNATLTIKQGATTLGTFTANATADNTIEIPAGFSGDYNDLTNKPTIPTVNNGTLTIKQDGTTVGTFTANQGTDQIININTPAEAQVLHISNDTIFLTGGSFVKLPAGFSGDYNDLSNQPTIPTVNNATLTLKNGSSTLGTFTANASADNTIDINVPAQVNADWDATSGVSQILHKPALATVATSGNYNDLSNKPTIPTVNNGTLTIKQDGTTVGTFTANQGTNQTVNITSPTFTESQILSINSDTIFLTGGSFVKLPAGFSGDYNDLVNNPTALSQFTNDANFVTADQVKPQVQADWDEASSDSIAYIKNKPTDLGDFTNAPGYITATDVPAQVQADWDEADASSKAYIQNKPIIPEQVKADWDVTDTASKAFILNKPDMSQYLTATDLGTLTGFVSMTGNDSVTGNKKFGGNDVFTGTVEVPSVLSVNADTFAITGSKHCEQAVNICDLQEVYDNILQKFKDLNNQLDKLQDSIKNLNKELNTPKDGKACPTVPTVHDFEGNTYNTVQLGNQCWMKESFRGKKFADGTSITYGNTSISTSTPYYYYANKDTSTANKGLLYNWAAVMHGASPSSANPSRVQGICPDGWHVPSQQEWKLLSDYVNSKYSGSYRYLACDNPTSLNCSECNETGFSVYKLGYTEGSTTSEYGHVENSNAYGDFWSCTKSSGYPYAPYIASDIHYNWDSYSPARGQQVRCVLSEDKSTSDQIKPWTAPKVKTVDSTSNITQNSVTIGFAVLTDKGGDVNNNCRCGLLISTNSNPTFANVVKRAEQIVYVSDVVPMTCGTWNVTGLSTNTQYYFRAYAINTVDTALATEIYSFHTVEDGLACPGLPTYKDINGNVYNTVMIGSQCWLKENLRVNRYADNTPIDSASTSSTTKAYFRKASYNATLAETPAGYSYNLPAVLYGTTTTTVAPSNIQGICPLGWHVPSWAEYDTLRTYVSRNTSYQCGSNADNIRPALSAKRGWLQKSTVSCSPAYDTLNNNATNFSAVRNESNYCYLWNASGTSFTMGANYAGLPIEVAYGKSTFMGVRCVKDNLTTAQITAPTIQFSMTDNTVTEPMIKKLTITNTGGENVTIYDYCWIVDSMPYPSMSTNVERSTNFTNISSPVLAVSKSKLIGGKTYYIRVLAFTSRGYVYSDQKSFVAPTAGTACAEAPTVKDAENNVYKTVKIGSQCWMAQNLKSKKLPGTTTGITSYGETMDGISYFAAEILHGAAADNSSTSVQGICPTGWHLPSTSEFSTLITSVSSNPKDLASTESWKTSSVTGAPGNDPQTNNASGFNALPTGYWYSSVMHAGEQVWLMGAGYRYIKLCNDQSTITLASGNNGMHTSVRCIKGATPPSVATTSSPTVTANKAIVAGQVYTDGGSSITEVGICYAISTVSTTPTISNSTKTVTAAVGSYTVTLTSLDWGSTYYYRAYAKNSNGVQYGEVKSFNTKSRATVSTVTTPSSLTKTSVTLKGNVTSLGSGSITRKEIYVYKLKAGATPGAISSYETSLTKYGYVTTNLTSTGNYSVNITGLTPGEYYAYRATVNQTIDGVTVQSYASEYGYFRTNCAPEVQTDDITFIGTTALKFKVNGTVNSVGQPSITKKGFVYSYATSAPSELDLKHYGYQVSVTNSSDLVVGSYSSERTAGSSSAGKTVYVKAYALNGTDTVYGSMKSYTLPSVASVNISNRGIYPGNYDTYVTTSSINSGYSCTSNGGSAIVEAGLVYSTSNSTPTVGGTGCNTAPIDEKVVGSYKYTDITGLSAGTKYYIRAYVRTAAGYAYSSDVREIKTKISCGGTLYDQDNNSYGTVAISYGGTTNCWMKANMKATHFDNNNHTEIIAGTGYPSATTPHWYSPNLDPSKVSTYGRLYDYAAVSAATITTGTSDASLKPIQGICPRGWHVPSKSELQHLQNWYNNSTASQISSFSIKYAGIIINTAADNFDQNCYLFSRNDDNTSFSTNYSYIYIKSDMGNGIISRSPTSYYYALSVRCVQN